LLLADSSTAANIEASSPISSTAAITGAGSLTSYPISCRPRLFSTAAAPQCPSHTPARTDRRMFAPELRFHFGIRASLVTFAQARD